MNFFEITVHHFLTIGHNKDIFDVSLIAAQTVQNGHHDNLFRHYRYGTHRCGEQNPANREKLDVIVSTKPESDERKNARQFKVNEQNPPQEKVNLFGTHRFVNIMITVKKNRSKTNEYRFEYQCCTVNAPCARRPQTHGIIAQINRNEIQKKIEKSFSAL